MKANPEPNTKMMSLRAYQQGGVTQRAAPCPPNKRSSPCSPLPHWELLGTEPFEVYYLRVKRTRDAIHCSCSSWDSQVSQGCGTAWELLRLCNETHEEQAGCFAYCSYSTCSSTLRAEQDQCWCVTFTFDTYYRPF